VERPDGDVVPEEEHAASRALLQIRASKLPCLKVKALRVDTVMGASL
jgi:hypothetical protein